jgi:TolA-binding protein
MTAPAKWIPDDDALDALARGLPIAERAPDRAEDGRTALLTSAATVAQQPRSSRTRVVAAISALAAAAAVLVVWLVTRTADAPAAKDSIAPVGVAQYERASGWPDFVVRIDDGRVAIAVAPLADGERFRAKTADAEIEVRGAHFVVGAERGRLTSVAVTEGRAELRWGHEPTVFLSAGDAWAPVQTAQRDLMPPPDRVPAPPVAVPAATTEPTATAGSATATTEPTAAAGSAATTTPAPGRATTTNRPARVSATPRTATTGGAATTTRTSTATPPATTGTPPATRATPPATTGTPLAPTATPPATTATPPATTATPPAKAEPASPGETDFRAGVAALRAGDAVGATKSFAAACQAAARDALGEDACFWVGAAARRANQTAVARDALTAFLARYPRSSRAGEAAALLGWLLYEGGQLDLAEQRFQQAAADRVPGVRASAAKGLEAIRRSRAK